MQVVFIIGAIQALFLAIIVLAKKNKMLSDKILTIWLLFMGLHLMSQYMNIINVIWDYPIFLVFTENFAMLVGIFTFLYVSVVTSKIQKFKWQYLIHFILYISLTIILLIRVNSNIDFSAKDYILNLPGPFLFPVFHRVNMIIGPLYMVFCILLLKRHKKSIAQNFSYTKNIDLKWLLYVVYTMSVVWVVVVITTVVIEFNAFLVLSGVNLMFTTLAVAVFFLGFFGIKQQVIYPAPSHIVDSSSSLGSLNESPEHIAKVKNTTDYLNSKTKGKKYSRSGLNEVLASEIHENLKSLMQESSAYKDERLNLVELSRRLQVHPNYLSQVINEQEGKNFFNYINTLRINEFLTIATLPENEKYTMISLAYDCGFSSKSTFNKHFKLVTGKTPTEYFNATRV